MGRQHSRLSPKNLAELRDQTNFTVEEIHKWYKEFRINWPNGNLTMKDFRMAYSTFFPLGDATEFVMHVFRVFDLNGDGILDFREFMCGFSVVLRGSVDEKLTFSFRIYDVDGNGFISREEMTQVLSVCIQIQ
jgi:Ca2+-binding EF-hand superfamily protein